MDVALAYEWNVQCSCKFFLTSQVSYDAVAVINNINNINNGTSKITEKSQQPLSSDSDYEKDEEGMCEEVGFEDYDDDQFEQDEGNVNTAKPPS